jgi:hypothetical protein
MHRSVLFDVAYFQDDVQAMVVTEIREEEVVIGF